MGRDSMMRRLQVVAMTAVVVLGLGMLARHVTAYTTDGHAWGVRQVPYYINPENLYVSESSAVAAITSAAAAWRGIANVELVYAGYTTGSSLTNNRKNEVFFRNDSSSYIAETYWWYDGTGQLVDADIVFHESSRFYSANLGCNGDGFYIENTGAHEFGHALGLGHSAVEMASMWPNSGACETIRETLDADDIAGLGSLYPGSSSPPPTAPPTAPSSPPSAPAGPSPADGATNVNANVTLGWTASNASKYDVYLNGALVASNVTTTSLRVSSIQDGAPYSWQVVAKNTAGSTLGPTWSFTTRAKGKK
jgi:hypothetical protein